MSEKKGRILIIDDEFPFVKGLKLQLENHGYDVEAAYDGLDGLEKARKSHFHLTFFRKKSPILKERSE